MMTKLIWLCIIAIGLCFIFFFLVDPPLQEKVVESYYVTNRGRYYWNKLKQPAFRFRSLFFTPTSVAPERNFEVHRNRGEGNRGEGRGHEEGKTTTTTEAVEKSVEKTKETIEDFAKSAADMAGEAAYKAAGVVKDTVAQGTMLSSDPQDEL